MSKALAGYLLAAACLTVGFGWFSPGLGLIVLGVCVAAITTIATLDIGGSK